MSKYAYCSNMLMGLRPVLIRVNVGQRCVAILLTLRRKQALEVQAPQRGWFLALHHIGKLHPRARLAYQGLGFLNLDAILA